MAYVTLSIIIVNWNTRDMLIQCLRSIYDDVVNQQGIDLEIIVVDNGSTDGSAEAVRRNFSEVRVVANQENVGFARANNQAIAVSRGQYVLLLNPDTQVMSGALLRLVEFMEAHPDAGAAGARIINPDHTLQASCSRVPTLTRELWFLFHLDTLWPYAEYRMARWEEDRARRVEVLLGACLLLRRVALDQVGTLDEDFFMYSEEVDLGYRLCRGGWNLYWVPQAEVIHHGGQSTGQIPSEMFLQLYQSKVRFFRKHHGRIGGRLYKCVLLLASLPRAMLPFSPSPAFSAHRQYYKPIGGNYRRLIIELPRL